MTVPLEMSTTLADDKKEIHGDSYPQCETEKGSLSDHPGLMGEVIDDAYLAHEKSLVRKLDLTLMPIVFILYLLNYLDRNNIACVTWKHSRVL